MHVRIRFSSFRLAGALVALAGTASVQVNFITRKLGVTATFAHGTGDLPGVDLGSLAPFAATGVSLSNVNVLTGASFTVPFTNSTDSFQADGDVACPAGGCTTIPGTFATVGHLDPPSLHISLLPASHLYTFDGSVDCTGNAVVGVSCSGPFALNFFDSATVQTGAQVVVPGTHGFFDPLLGRSRTFDTRVTLTDVTAGGTLDVTAFSRLRGAIPAPYLTSTDGFDALYFDVATDAVFTDAEICVVVDADHDGVVDGTATAVSRLAGLHFVGGAFVVENIRIDDIYACLTVSSLSPFALVASPSASTTTTSTIPEGSSTTTSTTVATGSSTTVTTTTTPGAGATTTTLPACQTARDCLERLKSSLECPEGLDPKLGSFIDRKVSAALGKLAKAAGNQSKARKFEKRAAILVHQIDQKAAALAKRRRKPISAECRESVGQLVTAVLGVINGGLL